MSANANIRSDRVRALHALKMAILDGATSHYEQLVSKALAAGATDDEIDALVHEVLQALFASAEQPLTARQLAHGWPGVHIRH